MNKVNELVICRKQYDSAEEWENAIKKAILLLLDAGYIMTVRYDEPGLGIVCIEYDSADEKLGGPQPCWLRPEEYERIAFDDEEENK